MFVFVVLFCFIGIYIVYYIYIYIVYYIYIYMYIFLLYLYINSVHSVHDIGILNKKQGELLQTNIADNISQSFQEKSIQQNI